MAAPVAIASMGMSLVSGLMGAQSAKAEGRAAADMYSYRAAIAKANEKIAAQNKDYAWLVGGRQMAARGLKAGQERAAIRAAQAASGINVAEGSAKDVQESHDLVYGMDIAAIKSTAARQAYAADIEALRASEEGVLMEKAAQESLRAADTKAKASILGSISSVSSKWLQGQQTGLWGSGSSSWYS